MDSPKRDDLPEKAGRVRLMISSTVLPLIAPGEAFGGRDRGSTSPQALAQRMLALLVQPGLRADTTSVSPGQSQKMPLAERFASSARTSLAKSSRRSPNRCGAADDIER
jgi:hypothetical protein